MATDDGTYLERIDPLGGQWKVEQVGDDDFSSFNAWVNFSAGGFVNHGAGCSAGYPAFYSIDGARISFTRIEPVRIGHCQEFNGPDRQSAIGSERRLAAFLDGLIGWRRLEDGVLILTTRDGVQAILTRPTEPHPDLAGRWVIERIDGEPLVTETRPAILSFAMNGIGAYADCNSFGGTFEIPAPSRIVVVGPIVSTAIGCPPEDQAEDELIAQAMQGATAYEVRGSQLILSGGLGLTAHRPPEPARRLPGEYEACGNTLLGGYHEGPITLVIDELTMRDNAGCQATYTAVGPELTVFPDGADCTGEPTPYTPGEPIPLGGEISPLSLVPPDGFGFDEEGRLILRTHRGLLGMCRVGSPPPFGQ